MKDLQKQDDLVTATKENTKAVNELKVEIEKLNKKLAPLSMLNFFKKGE